jgi:hypothetical protein
MTRLAASPRPQDNPGQGRHFESGPVDANLSGALSGGRRENGAVADALDPAAELLYLRWRRAVDLLWREAVLRRELGLAERERARSARRMKSLQKIVRKALADYHRIELERQRRAERRPEIGSR